MSVKEVRSLNETEILTTWPGKIVRLRKEDEWIEVKIFKTSKSLGFGEEDNPMDYWISYADQYCTDPKKYCTARAWWFMDNAQEMRKEWDM